MIYTVISEIIENKNKINTCTHKIQDIVAKKILESTRCVFYIYYDIITQYHKLQENCFFLLLLTLFMHL